MKFRFHKYGAAPVLSVANYAMGTAAPASIGVQVDLSATPWQDAPALVLLALFDITQGFVADTPQTGTATIYYAFSQNPCTPNDAISVLRGRASSLACQIKSEGSFPDVAAREFATARLPITGRYLTLWYNGDGAAEDVQVDFAVHAIPCE